MPVRPTREWETGEVARYYEERAARGGGTGAGGRSFYSPEVRGMTAAQIKEARIARYRTRMALRNSQQQASGFNDNFGLGDYTPPPQTVTQTGSSANSPSPDPVQEASDQGGLLAQLTALAASKGMSLLQMADTWVRDNPALAAAIGVGSGAALVAMLVSAAGKTTTTSTKTSSKKTSSKKTSKKKTSKKTSARKGRANMINSSRVKRVWREARKLHGKKGFRGSLMDAYKKAWNDEAR